MAPKNFRAHDSLSDDVAGIGRRRRDIWLIPAKIGMALSVAILTLVLGLDEAEVRIYLVNHTAVSDLVINRVEATQDFATAVLAMYIVVHALFSHRLRSQAALASIALLTGAVAQLIVNMRIMKEAQESSSAMEVGQALTGALVRSCWCAAGVATLIALVVGFRWLAVKRDI